MFMGFAVHFYIIFGTNLLTGGPTQIAVFLPISVFRRKGISNGVQTEWNLRECDFRNKHDPEDLEWTSSNRRGSHEVGARPPPSWAPHGSTDLLLPPIYTYVPPNHQKRPRKPNSTAATFCPVRSHLGAFSGILPEGALITEGFYINTIASPMMCQ